MRHADPPRHILSLLWQGYHSTAWTKVSSGCDLAHVAALSRLLIASGAKAPVVASLGGPAGTWRFWKPILVYGAIHCSKT